MDRIQNPPTVVTAQPDGTDWQLTISVNPITQGQIALIRPLVLTHIGIDVQIIQKPMPPSRRRTLACQFELQASGCVLWPPDESHSLVHSLAHLIHDHVPECHVQVEARCLGECLTVVLSASALEGKTLAWMSPDTSFIEIEVVCFEPESLARAMTALRLAQPTLNVESDLGSLTLRGWGDLATPLRFSVFGATVSAAIWSGLGQFAIVLAYQYDAAGRMLDEQTYALPAYSAWLSSQRRRRIPITWICGPDGREPESIWTRRSLRPRASGL